MKKRIVFLIVFIFCVVSPMVFAQEGSAAAPQPWRYIAAAIAVSLACIGGGIAVGQIGAAAMGAMSEKPELAGKAIPFIGLAEGICLWGFLVALLILIM